MQLRPNIRVATVENAFFLSFCRKMYLNLKVLSFWGSCFPPFPDLFLSRTLKIRRDVPLKWSAPQWNTCIATLSNQFRQSSLLKDFFCWRRIILTVKSQSTISHKLPMPVAPHDPTRSSHLQDEQHHRWSTRPSTCRCRAKACRRRACRDQGAGYGYRGSASRELDLWFTCGNKDTIANEPIIRDQENERRTPRRVGMTKQDGWCHEGT